MYQLTRSRSVAMGRHVTPIATFVDTSYIAFGRGFDVPDSWVGPNVTESLLENLHDYIVLSHYVHSFFSGQGICIDCSSSCIMLDPDRLRIST